MPPILKIDVINIINKRHVKNIIAQMYIIEVPISFNPLETLESLIGSHNAAVIF